MITVRGVQCMKCMDEVWSRCRHDMRSCKCGEVSVDGGRAYIRITGDPEKYRFVSIVLQMPDIGDEGYY